MNSTFSFFSYEPKIFLKKITIRLRKLNIGLRYLKKITCYPNYSVRDIYFYKFLNSLNHKDGKRNIVVSFNLGSNPKIVF